MAQDRPRVAKRYHDFIGQPDNYSGRINNIIGRYQQIVSDSMPELAKNEWLAIMDANNGTVFPGPDDSTELDPARYAWMNVADSEAFHINEAFGVDNLALAKKMKSMTFIEQCGVMEVILQFWTKSDQQFSDYSEMLTAAGAKITQ